MDSILNLFRLIKNHQYEDMISQLSEDDDIDVNIKDNSNNYLIHYAILFNRKDIVTLLINKGARLDVTDTDGRSILHIAIKYDYYDILELLIHFNRTVIGVSLVDIRDSHGSIPLHYSIMFKNKRAVNLLIDAGSDTNIRNEDGNNSLHLAIYSKDLEILSQVLKSNIDINSRTVSGETALHLACNYQILDMVEILLNTGIDVNKPDTDNELTALDYSVNLNNAGLVKLLIIKNANPNHQDYYGNSALHYCIMEDNPEIFHLLINSEKTRDIIEVNLQNIDGSTPLHLSLIGESKYRQEYIKYLIPISDINIQDNQGDTVLHLLVELNIWKNYYDMLKIKKLHGFIENDRHKRPYDLVKNADQKIFLKLLAESYLYSLKDNIEVQWEHEWENICGLQTVPKEKSDKLKQFIKHAKKDSTDDEKCLVIITETLEQRLEQKGSISQPHHPSYVPIDILEGEKLKLCTYTGISLDIISGLIYIIKNFKDTAVSFDKSFDKNEVLIKKYRDRGYNVESLTEFTNFEIVWMENSIHFPLKFDQRITFLINNPQVRFIVIPIGIQLKEGNHANILIYDKKINEIERFEPNGSSPPYRFNYNDSMLDHLLQSKFEGLIPEVKYVSPREYLPRIGFQYLDAYERNRIRIGDPSGFCAVWTIWYAETRIQNKDVDRKQLVRKLIRNAKRQSVSFKNMIRNYSSKIIKIRDEALDPVGIDINDWLNNNITKNQSDGVVENLRRMISKFNY